MINIYKQELTILQEEILKFLMIHAGKKFNVLGIAKALKKTQAGVIKAIFPLEEKELITANQDKESKRWKIELNRNNPQVINLKRANNLKLIYESKLFDFLEEKFPGTIIILFGSYSKGEDIYNSDIDIAIIDKKEKIINLTKYNQILKKDINLNFYSNFKKIHKNLKENIINGIVLSGVIEI